MREVALVILLQLTIKSGKKVQTGTSGIIMCTIGQTFGYAFLKMQYFNRAQKKLIQQQERKVLVE